LKQVKIDGAGMTLTFQIKKAQGNRVCLDTSKLLGSQQISAQSKPITLITRSLATRGGIYRQYLLSNYQRKSYITTIRFKILLREGLIIFNGLQPMKQGHTVNTRTTCHATKEA
jgi:hypothetical protein